MIDFFSPKSVAVIGASKNPEKLGYQLLKNLKEGGYRGKIFPVNLDEKLILSLKAYASVLDIHQKIDQAVIIVPREVVPLVLKQCIEKEIPSVIIISAGFAEKDDAGRKIQEEVKNILKGSSTRLIGPNCLGIISTENLMNLTFALAKVSVGKIGLILQSGAIGSAILDWAKETRVGISKFISLGNMVDISELEALELLGKDPATEVIAVYLEELKNPAEFIRIAKKITPHKPIVVLKGGMTSYGQKAASSHTGALAVPSEQIKAVFRQSDLIEVTSYEEMLNFLYLFNYKNINLKDNSLAIVTNAGGPGILAADAAYEAHLSLKRMSPAKKNQLKKSLQKFASLENPYDLGGDAKAEDYQKTIEFLKQSKIYSSMLVIITPQTSTEIDKTLQVIKNVHHEKMPIVAALLGGESFQAAKKILANKIPYFSDPTTAVKLLGKINYYEENDRTSPEIVFSNHGRRSEHSEDDLIRIYHLPFVTTNKVNSDGQIMAFIEEHGFPVAVKTAKNITHKGKSQKVGLNINDANNLNRVVHKIGFPILIQKMVDSPYEILIGARRDGVFGLTLFFGQGGIFVEEQKDFAVGVWPLTRLDLDEMIEATKVFQTIKQFQVKAEIKEVMIKLLEILNDNYDIESIELNPLKVFKNKLIAVDINITYE